MKTLITKLSPWMHWLCGIKPEPAPREPEPPPPKWATEKQMAAFKAALVAKAEAELGIPAGQLTAVKFPLVVVYAEQQGGVCVCERCRARRRVEQLMGAPCPN